MDNGAFDKIFSAAAGVWALVAMGFVALFKAWPLVMERINERRRDNATERAGDFSRLRDEVERLSNRVEALEAKLLKCEEDRDNWRTRAVDAEADLVRHQAYELGLGEGKQTAQLIVSSERKEIDDNKKGGK